MARKRVLVIPDLHCPGMLASYPEFLRDTYRRWKCDTVVCLGDIFNFTGLSFHLKQTSDLNIDAEISIARKDIKRLVKMFPDVSVLTGNHDDLSGRQCDVVGVPRTMLRTFNDFWDMPKTWKWYPRYHQLKVDGVIYQHGDRGRGGQMAALKNAQDEFASVIQGHYHSQCGIWFHANLQDLIFGMQAGCGIDHDNPIFNYSRAFTKKPIISCGVVIEGKYPYIERMVL